MATISSLSSSPQNQTPTKTSPSSSSTAVTTANQQSPRNTANALATNGTYVSFGPVEVSKSLQDGEKFVKWDEVSCFFVFPSFALFGNFLDLIQVI